MQHSYDAVVLISFGGPEKPADVMPFLQNVLRGKNVPRERMLDVAERYESFGGVSPINEENRALLRSLVGELNEHGPRLPVYWGNRNWHPLLADTMRQMADDGVRRALAFVTSAFASYSSCRQYLEDIQAARQQVGPDAPVVDKLRLYYNHPGFIEPMAERVGAALGEIPSQRRGEARLVYTAHSIPLAMARNCAYEEQLGEACRLVSQQLGRSDWRLAYQSRSGPPSQEWLGPELGEELFRLPATGRSGDVVIAPIGFVLEQMEIVWDLDVEIRGLAQQLGLNMVRSAAVSCHPRFVTMIRELILERLEESPARLALGEHGPSHDVCPADCCRRG